MPPPPVLTHPFIHGGTKKFHTRGLNRDLVGGNFAISMPARPNRRFLRVLQGGANVQAPSRRPENPKKWGISRNLNRALRMTTWTNLGSSRGRKWHRGGRHDRISHQRKAV